MKIKYINKFPMIWSLCEESDIFPESCGLCFLPRWSQNIPQGSSSSSLKSGRLKFLHFARANPVCKSRIIHENFSFKKENSNVIKGLIADRRNFCWKNEETTTFNFIYIQTSSQFLLSITPNILIHKTLLEFFSDSHNFLRAAVLWVYLSFSWRCHIFYHRQI